MSPYVVGSFDQAEEALALFDLVANARKWPGDLVAYLRPRIAVGRYPRDAYVMAEQIRATGLPGAEELARTFEESATASQGFDLSVALQIVQELPDGVLDTIRRYAGAGLDLVREADDRRNRSVLATAALLAAGALLAREVL